MRRKTKSRINGLSSSNVFDSMDSHIVTMLFRYGSHVAVKVAYPTTKLDAMIDFVCGKWNFMNDPELALLISSSRSANAI